MIPYSCQSISEEDIDAVVRVLRSDFLTQGPGVPGFEKALGDYCGAECAVAVSSGTAALHLACLAMGLGPGDCLWTSPVTFVASANCALYCGASVDFVDIDPRTYNMCTVALERKLEAAESLGQLPKIVVPVHLAGQSCDMRELRRLSRKFGFFVLEDASHALGAEYAGRKVGCCEYSDAAVHSFHAVKMITTGEGGAVLTNDEALADKISILRTHGITRQEGGFENSPDGPWYYEQKDLGLHYRLTDIQAALGESQLKRLEDFLTQRRHIAGLYNAQLANSAFTLPWQAPETLSSWHLFVVLCPDAKNRKAIFNTMREAGVGVNVHYIPVYLQPYFQKLGFARGLCPAAEEYYSRALSLPVHAKLTSDQVGKISKTLMALS